MMLQIFCALTSESLKYKELKYRNPNLMNFYDTMLNIKKIGVTLIPHTNSKARERKRESRTVRSEALAVKTRIKTITRP